MNKSELTYSSEELATVALGCLLHDIGKPLQRASNNPFQKNHQRFGREFIDNLAKEKSLINNLTSFQWMSVLDSIRYHHAKEGPSNSKSYISWIAYEADNLASAHDRHTAEFLYSEDKRIDECEIPEAERDSKWDNERRLQSIFTYFQNHTAEREKISFYDLWLKKDEDKKDLNPYPYPCSLDSISSSVSDQYKKIEKLIRDFSENLINKEKFDTVTLNQVSCHLEELFQFIPPDTYTGHTNDVSLYEHLKLTAAIGSCMFAYIHEYHYEWIESHTTDTSLNSPWSDISRSFREKKAYILFKADISGIQEFIYNISSKQALKGLRGRSFYLELLCQQIADEILGLFKLGRVNQIYLGGGGFSLLLPNTSLVNDSIKELEDSLNEWLLKLHDGKLSISFGYTELSGNELKMNSDNIPKEGHPLNAAWKRISEMIGDKKLSKFKNNLDEIFTMKASNYEECKFCHKETGSLIPHQDSGSEDTKICNECKTLIYYGDKIQGDKIYFNFKESNSSGLFPRINNEDLSINSLELEISDKKTDKSFVVRDLDKELLPKIYLSTTLAKEHHKTLDFTELAKEATGVKRIGVLRADVDNLGKAFKSNEGFGFEAKYKSLSRDTSLSRSLARFFTVYLDDLLKDTKLKDSITVVYAGGDDLFLVGAWDKVIDAAILINDKFKIYSLGALSISAGISIHAPKFPLYRMAEAAGSAEAVAKAFKDAENKAVKNSLCVFFDDNIFRKDRPAHTFTWDGWNKVLAKVSKLESFKLSTAYLYQVLIHLRELIYEEQSYSFPRLIYMTARMEEKNEELKALDDWREFTKELFESFEQNKKEDIELRVLETALNYLLLSKRENTTERGDDNE